MEFKASSTNRSQRPFAVLVIIAAVLQVALAPQVSIFGGRINFMLVLVAALSVSGDSRTMVYLGFFCGLFYDLTSTAPVGLMTLLLTVAGYFASAISRGLTSGTNMESVRAVAVTILLVNLVYAAALRVMGIETNLLVALGTGLISSVLDIAVAFLVLAFSPASEQSRGFSAAGTGRRGGTRYKGMR